MFRSILMGSVAGQRAMTPLATVAIAAARAELPRDNGAPRLLGRPVVAAGALALAVAEMAGDKMKSAPDRIAPAGLAARFLTAAIVGAALAPRDQRWAAAALTGAVAVAAAWPGWRTRMSAMKRSGRVATGFAEDVAVLGSAIAVMRLA